MHGGVGLHEGAAAEQYECSSYYSINVIIARHESSVSSEAEAHAALLIAKACLKRAISATSEDILVTLVNVDKLVSVRDRPVNLKARSYRGPIICDINRSRAGFELDACLDQYTLSFLQAQ